MKKLALFLSIFFLLSGLSLATNSSPAFTIKNNPDTMLKYDATPGSTITDYITVYNLDPTRWIEVSLSQENLPARWFRLEPKTTRIAPNSQKKIKITLVIPNPHEYEEKTGIITATLSNHDSKSNTQGLRISLSIGATIRINILQGEPAHQDFTQNIFKNIEIQEQKNNTPKTYIVTKRLSIKATISNLFVIIENNINVVLLLIIVALILRISLNKGITASKKQDTSSKTDKKDENITAKGKNTPPKTDKKSKVKRKSTSVQTIKKPFQKREKTKQSTKKIITKKKE